MSDEDKFRKIVGEEMKKAIMENLDSSLIFTYIQNLEKELEQEKEKNNPNYISKDKIREKIEYYQKTYSEDNSPNDFLISQDCLSKLSILKELLEE